MECSVEDEELDDSVAEKVEELLLLRLVPMEAREAAVAVVCGDGIAGELEGGVEG
jgi:hypothetical protein